MKAKFQSEPLWLASVLLALAGAVDSAYLAFLKFTGTVAACSDIGDCEAVNFLILETRFPSWRDSLHLGVFGFTLAGTIYSVYLTYIEIFVLHAVCPYCVISAVVMLLLFVISIIRLRRLGFEN
jgi:uncharacterized membrane protein